MRGRPRGYQVVRCTRCQRTCSAAAQRRWFMLVFLGCTYRLGAHLEHLSKPCCSHRRLPFCTARCMHAGAAEVAKALGVSS